MDPFPLPKLPFLAQKVVINQMDLISAIELSMISKKFERVLQQTKITVDRFEYSFTRDSFSLIIGLPPASCLTIDHSFTTSDTTNIWNIDGNELDIVKEMKDFSRCSRVIVKNKTDTNKLKLNSLEKITGHLLKFLRVKNFNVSIKTNLDILNLFIWKYTKNFDTIELQSQYIELVIVNPGEIKLLLETLTINVLFLYVHIRTYHHLKYFSSNQRPPKIRKIKIIESDWLEHDSLLNMAQESIECQISTGISGKANEIIKKWISGENEKLEYLRLWTNEYREECNENQIFMSINATPSVFQLDEIGKICNIFFKSAIVKDIQRENDGCQATVAIQYFSIDLFVWNEKHLKAIGRI